MKKSIFPIFPTCYFPCLGGPPMPVTEGPLQLILYDPVACPPSAKFPSTPASALQHASLAIRIVISYLHTIFVWGGNESLAACCIFWFSFVVGLVLRKEPFKKKYWIWGPRRKWNYLWGPSLEEYPGAKYAHTIQTERESKQRISLLFPWQWL